MPKIVKMFKFSTEYNAFSYSTEEEYEVGDKLPAEFYVAMSTLLGAKTQMATILSAVANGVTEDGRDGITLENIQQYVHLGVKEQVKKAYTQFKGLSDLSESEQAVKEQYERFVADFKFYYKYVTTECKEVIEGCKELSAKSR